MELDILEEERGSSQGLRVEEIKPPSSKGSDANRLNRRKSVELKMARSVSVVSASKQPTKLEGKSLLCISPTSCLRVRLQQIIYHPYFESTIIYLIALNSFLMSQDTPDLSSDSHMKRVILKYYIYIDY